MTVANTTARKTFAGNGSTTSFATSPMVFFDATDLTVYVVTTATGAVVATLALTTDYTVTGGAGTTGTVATTGLYGAPATGQTLVIVRSLPRLQETDFENNDPNDADVAEEVADRVVMIAQELDAKFARTAKLADTDVSGAVVTLPTPSARKAIVWTSNGLALENSTYDPDTLQTAAAASASAAASSASAAATSASAASTSASSAATSASNASTSASAASTSASAAAASAALIGPNLGTTTTVLHGNAAGNPSYGAVVEADITLADNTTNDVSTSKHGFVPKAPNDATKFLNGTGAFSVPAATAAAAQSDQETGTSTTLFVSPGRQQYHPSAAKGWCQASVTGTAVSSYNVTSVTDVGTGAVTIVWDIDFSSNNYCPVALAITNLAYFLNAFSIVAGSTPILCFNVATVQADPTQYGVAVFGDQ